MKCRVVLLLAAVLLAAGTAAAEDREIVALARELGAVLEWDPLTDTGVLLVGDDRIALAIGAAEAVVNYRLVVPLDPPVRKDGAVWITTAAVKALGDALREDRLAHVGERMRVGTIIIDPGHGGADGGASRTYGKGAEAWTLREKDVNLSLAQKLGALLADGMPDRQVVSTRTTDTTVSLDDRPLIANAVLEKTADTVLYVSIHANANAQATTATSGFEVWYLPPTYRRTVIDKSSVAPKDYDILPIMNSMLEEEISMETALLAQSILDGLDGAIGDRTVNRGLLQMDWYVVRNSRMPAVLVEVGFVNNAEEAKRLSDEAYLKDVARGLYSGIAAFIARFERGQQ